MIKKYAQEILVPENVKFELVGRAALFFAKSYPKNDEVLWWKIPEAFSVIIEESYRRGYAVGARIPEIFDGPQESTK